jgi:hypothetical protein
MNSNQALNRPGDPLPPAREVDQSKDGWDDDGRRNESQEIDARLELVVPRIMSTSDAIGCQS